MSLLESHWIRGVACDVRACTVQHRLPELIPAYGQESREFEADMFAAGWAKRIGRSVTWHCPGGHAERASRCTKGKYGACSRWCPVHKDGRVITGGQS
jgi:hypothetical protein